MSLSLRMTIRRESDRARIVHRLIGHARAHGAVADDGRRLVGLDRRGRAPRPCRAPAEIEVDEWPAPKESYSLSSRLREARKAARLTDRAHAASTPGQDLVGIGLMAYVPDQPVARRIEEIMQRDGQLDDAKARTEMAAGHRHRIDHLLPELGGELRQLGLRQSTEIFGRIDLIQNRRFRRPRDPCLHAPLPPLCRLVPLRLAIYAHPSSRSAPGQQLIALFA